MIFVDYCVGKINVSNVDIVPLFSDKDVVTKLAGNMTIYTNKMTSLWTQIITRLQKYKYTAILHNRQNVYFTYELKQIGKKIKHQKYKRHNRKSWPGPNREFETCTILSV